jgi:hypothetical protein
MAFGVPVDPEVYSKRAGSVGRWRCGGNILSLEKFLFGIVRRSVILRTGIDS